MKEYCILSLLFYHFYFLNKEYLVTIQDIYPRFLSCIPNILL